jgi:hypothetical protein
MKGILSFIGEIAWNLMKIPPARARLDERLAPKRPTDPTQYPPGRPCVLAFT